MHSPLPPQPPTPEDFEAREPGRGRLAQRPEHIPHKGWTDIFWRLGVSYFGDRIGFLSGGVTFFVMLSLFPTRAAGVTLYGLFADPADAWARLQFLYSFLPSGVARFLGDEMHRLAENTTTTLTFTLVWTLALSLWTANGAVKVLFYGLNVAYHEVERRNIVRYNLLCMGFTVGGVLALLLTSALVVGAPVVIRLFGLQEEWGLFAPLRWPLLLAGTFFVVNDGIGGLLAKHALVQPLTEFVGSRSQALVFAGSFGLLLALLAATGIRPARA